MQFFFYLAALFVVVQGKCKSKCKEEHADCLALHGKDVKSEILDSCVKSANKEGEETACSKCFSENKGKEEQPVQGQRQFICLSKCKWVAIGCTQAGINASNLLALMNCVSTSYHTELNKKRSPQCGACILTGECASYCNDRKEGEELCDDKEIAAIMEPCQKAKAEQDHCSKNNVRNCESLPICQLCNGQCIKSDQTCPDPEPTEEPAPAPGPKTDFFEDEFDYYRHCKKAYQGNKEGCKACGGKLQAQKGGCKVRPNKAACNKIGLQDVCKRARCKIGWADNKSKDEFKRCTNPIEGQESIFGPVKKKKKRRGR